MRLSLILLAVCTLATPCLASAPVTHHPVAEVNRTAIRLADVFEGVPQEIDRDIATAPAPGKSVTYDHRVLAKLADDYRLDWSSQSMGEKTVITRAATRVTLEMIQSALTNKLSEVDSLKTKNIDIAFDNRNLTVLLPADRAPDFTIANFSFDETNKRFRGEIVAQTGDQPVHLPVSGRVQIKKTIPVLARQLAAGTTLGESDLDWVTLNEDRVGIDVVSDVRSLVGQELRHNRSEGEFLRARDIMPQRLVTRGSLVTIKIETPSMLISTQGRALQDGGKGETIRITNIQSNRTVEGVVESSGIVRVGGLQKIASAEGQP